MATAMQNPTDQTATSLVSGIVDDIQVLVKQQLLLTRREIEADLHKALDGTLLCAIGAGILYIGAIVFSIALAYFLHWTLAPVNPDASKLPLWACHAIVGLVLLGGGGGLIWAGRSKFSAIQPMQSPATEAFKENVEWATNHKS